MNDQSIPDGALSDTEIAVQEKKHGANLPRLRAIRDQRNGEVTDAATTDVVKQNEIILTRSNGQFVATYTGPHSRRIFDLFGTTTLPTPFMADADPALVQATLQANHNRNSDTFGVLVWLGC